MVNDDVMMQVDIILKSHSTLSYTLCSENCSNYNFYEVTVRIKMVFQSTHF
jgi:hypothetical protein